MATPLPSPGGDRGTWGVILNQVINDVEDRLGGDNGVSISVDAAHQGLTLHFGPEPLPPASSMPNTVYFVLPTS